MLADVAGSLSLFIVIAAGCRFGDAWAQTCYVPLSRGARAIARHSRVFGSIYRGLSLSFVFQLIGWTVAVMAPFFAFDLALSHPFAVFLFGGEGLDVPHTNLNFLAIFAASAMCILKSLTKMHFYILNEDVHRLRRKDGLYYVHELYCERLSEDTGCRDVSKLLLLDEFIGQTGRGVILFAMLCFAAAKLGYVQYSGTGAPSLAESIFIFLSIINLTEANNVFSGNGWNLISAAFTAFLFFSTALFFQLASTVTVPSGQQDK